mmetsp:Transcript_172511/g.553024  ORF Transcript_172511/g.553024 Transcript_172511/m.553024 type:complete len:222 (-) Transcript_172511:198-863(-)
MAAIASFMLIRAEFELGSAPSAFEPYSRAKLWKARPMAASFDCDDSPTWLKAPHASGKQPGVFSKHCNTEFAKHVFPKFASPGSLPSASRSLTTSRATGFTQGAMAFCESGASPIWPPQYKPAPAIPTTGAAPTGAAHATAAVAAAMSSMETPPAAPATASASPGAAAAAMPVASVGRGEATGAGGAADTDGERGVSPIWTPQDTPAPAIPTAGAIPTGAA